MSNMKILIVGGGAREDALCWKLSSSPLVKKLYCAPGNPGTARYAENIRPGDLSACAIYDWAVNTRPDLVVIGPEAYLAAGLADQLTRAGIAVFGPSAAAAEIETSKVFAKQVMRKAKVPTAAYQEIHNRAAGLRYLSTAKFPVVIKMNNLAAGKGVRICHSLSEAQETLQEFMPQSSDARSFNAQSSSARSSNPRSPGGSCVLIEEFMEGREASVFAICSGTESVIMIPARDHKTIGEGNTGANTGGMGAFAPVTDAPDNLAVLVKDSIINPVLRTLVEMGRPFTGLLYAGLMLTGDGPKVVEFNARFGDPETQALLPLLQTDLAEILWAAVNKKLAGKTLKWDNRSSVCVVAASQGYPGKYQSGAIISGLSEAEAMGCQIFHAGTSDSPDGLVTAGGRVLNVVAQSEIGVAQAADLAYQGLAAVKFDGMVFRKDIAREILENRANRASRATQGTLPD